MNPRSILQQYILTEWNFELVNLTTPSKTNDSRFTLASSCSICRQGAFYIVNRVIEALDPRAKKKEETESCYFSAEGFDKSRPPFRVSTSFERFMKAFICSPIWRIIIQRIYIYCNVNKDSTCWGHRGTEMLTYRIEDERARALPRPHRIFLHQDGSTSDLALRSLERALSALPSLPQSTPTSHRSRRIRPSPSSPSFLF